MAGSVGSEEGDFGFQIAPMVDVVFVLMLFFMASAGQQVVEKELSMNLPSGQPSAATLPTMPIIVEITNDGHVSANDQEMGNPDDKKLLQLRGVFANSVEKYEGKNPVIVRPAPDTRHERVMDVLNAAAAAKVTKLTFGS
jgi:biopolymer transport protein ExbD